MKFYCIADEDTVRGFRLAGIAGQVVTTAQEVGVAVQQAVEGGDCGVMILTDKVAAGVRTQVDCIRFERDRPLIVEIPGPDGPLPGRRSLRQLVQEAVGMRLGQEEGD